MKVTFGEYIRSLRNQRQLTLTQLAAKLDLDTANLCKIENGKRDFDQKRLPKLAKTLEVNLKELKNEYVSDQIGKFIHENKCSKQLLAIAQEKAAYRKKMEQLYQNQSKI